jgi:LysM repeat protein
VEKSTKSTIPPQRKDAIRANIMNNPNPFVPQGSVLEQNKRRSRMKFAVSCVLAVSVASLSAILISSCKRAAENPTPEPNPFVDTNPPPVLDTNPPPVLDTNPPAVALPPVNPPPIPPVVPEATGTEYKVVKGDTLAKIAKNNHITLKALEDANPGVTPTRLTIGKKLIIPAGASVAPTTMGTSAGTETSAVSTGGTETYTVKPGDTLTRIAKAHNTTVKLLEAANNLTTTKIKVNQKLKIPAKPEAAAPVTAPPAAPVVPEPMTPPPATSGATSNP